MDKGTGKRKGKRRPRNKRAQADMKVDHAVAVTAAAASGVVVPLNFAAALFDPAVQEIDDEWAGSAPIIGPMPCPGDPACVLPGATSDIGRWRPRVLVARRSGSRSPRGVDYRQPASISAEASPLVKGHIASIVGLETRPDLSSTFVLLVEWDAGACRWVCRTTTNEQVRIKPEKLQSLNAAHQVSARQKFDAVDACSEATL